MPTSAGDDEGERNGEGERPILQRGRQQRLHDIGRIGAEHHHLAMRHVDDAHDAEGDRKADGRQQQNGRGREAVPEVLHDAPQGEARMDGARAPRRRALDRRIGRLLGDRVDEALRVLVAARLQRRDRGEAILRSRRCRWSRRSRPAASFERGGDARIALLGELRLERRQRLGVARVEHVAPAALRRFSGSGLASVSEPIAPSMALLQRVVDAHLLEGGGVGAGDRLAGLRVDERAVGGLVGDDMIGGIDHAGDCRRAPPEWPPPAAAPRRRVRRPPSRVCGNLSSRNLASVSSRASARAAAGASSATSQRRARRDRAA